MSDKCPSPLLRPFLKWPGGKFRIVSHLSALMPPKSIWVEPFVGAGAMFLNSPSKRFVLNDINSDLINIYEHIRVHKQHFIHAAKKHFHPSNNNKKRYYAIRDAFNHTTDPALRASLFIFLNRHGYNGLCRYNLKGKYNVPFGNYQKPYFPEKEISLYINKAQSVRFYNECYSDFFKRLLRSRQIDKMVIYCDPPYAPLSSTANFTGYAANKFGWDAQEKLTYYAQKCANQGASVFISNHDTLEVRKLYKKAIIHALMVSRTISCNTQNRSKVGEILAHFKPQ